MSNNLERFNIHDAIFVTRFCRFILDKSVYSIVKANNSIKKEIYKIWFKVLKKRKTL